MAVVVRSKTPAKLLEAVREAIDQGKVKTWRYDRDGDFVYSEDEESPKAWLRPTVEAERLILAILTSKDTKLSSRTYAVYHARFIEMLLRHFDQQFDSARATALPAFDDTL